jgi:hypothetical protein
LIFQGCTLRGTAARPTIQSEEGAGRVSGLPRRKEGDHGAERYREHAEVTLNAGDDSPAQSLERRIAQPLDELAAAKRTGASEPSN